MREDSEREEQRKQRGKQTAWLERKQRGKVEDYEDYEKATEVLWEREQ